MSNCLMNFYMFQWFKLVGLLLYRVSSVTYSLNFKIATFGVQRLDDDGDE